MKNVLLLLLPTLLPAIGTATPNDWQQAGTAEFTDGWILPYFEMTTDQKRTWQVEIEKSASSEIYRIVDPYNASGFIAKFETKPNTDVKTDIIIDCTDPLFVRVAYQPIFTFVPETFSTIEQPVWGHTRADYYENLGHTPQAITKAGLNNTLEDKTITLRECMIGFTADPATGTHTWNSGTFPTIIKLPPNSTSITEPSCDHTSLPEANGNPIYFNFQGKKINAPVHGQPCIIRQPDGTSKKIMP